ncbi:hypothetical protein DPMN_124906 [Dreissena polymorpha]|uniref:Uncharacterized protein n=1 Tax=Dreissena polymorpha TaxID=45954 RepID=A0A9D4GUE5_DREPO|nr:hypothetical protein DPMN_124906 [Dreissena polymorpha]
MAGGGGDFEVKRRKRTGCFCLLGLSEKVNTDILTQVIERKGPTVPMLHVFPSKSSSGKVVICLNVYDNHMADSLLEYDFWPRYISCRPWRTRATRQQSPRLRERRKRTDNRVDSPRFDSYDNDPLANRFSNLGMAVD